MLLAYIPDDGVYLVHDDSVTLNQELCFRFPEASHPLNTRLADFFQNQPGFFQYRASVLYTDCPYFQLITLERFPELQCLAFRVNHVNSGGAESESE